MIANLRPLPVQVPADDRWLARLFGRDARPAHGLAHRPGSACRALSVVAPGSARRRAFNCELSCLDEPRRRARRDEPSWQTSRSTRSRADRDRADRPDLRGVLILRPDTSRTALPEFTRGAVRRAARAVCVSGPLAVQGESSPRPQCLLSRIQVRTRNRPDNGGRYRRL